MELKPTHNQKDSHPIPRFKRILNFLMSLRFVYLFLFAFSLVVPTWISFDRSQYNWVQYYFTLASISLAILIKLWMIRKTITLKQFLMMQFNFLIPYCFTAINIVLWILSNQPYQQHQDIFNFSMVQVVTQSIFYALQTILASLISHVHTTTKAQYRMFLLTLMYYTGYEVWLLTSNIQAVDSALDQANQLMAQNIAAFVANQDSDIFMENCQTINQASGAYDLVKDFSIGLIASAIAELLIIMDMIGRPIEKMEIEDEIQKSKTFTRRFTSNINKIELTDRLIHQPATTDINQRKTNLF